MFVQLFFKYLTFEQAWDALIKTAEEIVRYFGRTSKFRGTQVEKHWVKDLKQYMLMGGGVY
jgi:hypothetical protein